MVLLFPSLAFSESIAEYPLEIRNQYPPFLIFLEPYPLSPEILAKGESTLAMDIAQSNSVQYKKSVRTTAKIDLEVTRTTFRYHYGINRFLEAGFELSMISLTKGIGDSGIIGYHNALGLPNGNHDYYNMFSFQYEISEGRDQYFNLKPVTAPGDSVLFLKSRLLPESKFLPAVSLVLYAKLPTGSLKAGTGSGKADGAIGLVLKKSTSLFNFYLNLVGVGVANPFRNMQSYAGSYGYGIFTIEYKYSRTLSVLMQYDYKMSPYHSALNQLRTPASILSFGFNKILFENHVLQMSFSEDLTHYTVPDVSGQICWKMHL